MQFLYEKVKVAIMVFHVFIPRLFFIYIREKGH